MKTPSVTAIIPSLYKVDGNYLKLCVESLRSSGFKGEIIVVTNGTNTAEPLNIKGITTRLHTRDQGQCNVVNIGAQVATGDYIFVINADMYFSPGWDENLRFDDLCFSPNLVEPTNNAGSAKPFLKFDGGVTLDEFKRDEVDSFIDTTDFQMKVELAGIIPKRLRDVLVYHFSNKSGTFDFSQPQRQAHWQNNFDYLRDKWGFDRDEAGSDTWYCKDMIMWGKLKYHPKWKGRYAKTS